MLLALLLVPSTALAQSAGDEQYTDPVTTTPPPSQPQSNPGSPGAGSGSGSSSVEGSPSSSSTDTTSNNVISDKSGSNTLPATGLPAAVLLIVGLLFTFSGRGLSRASREPAPDPHAGRSPDVPASSPVARAARRRSPPSSH